jgi:diamine N-acetyltransferase
MNFTVREAGIHEAEFVADISRQTFYDTFFGFNSKEDMDIFMEEQFTRESLVKEVGREGYKFFFVEAEGEVAGYVKLREGRSHLTMPATALEIARLYVLEPWIGKGAGKILMEHSIAYARENKFELIWLGVWEKNVRAIEFYHKWGFEKFGDTNFVLGNDIQRDWLMKKEL